ncbi:MAG: hypothetical protein GTO03_14215, partial [Planctomycetales bacterium]|nr:hypothetical protein [Planctomycetales bacterium]
RVAAWCQPEWTVVSSGFAAVDPEVIGVYGQEGRRLLQTSVCGATTVRIRQGRLTVSWLHNHHPNAPT